MKRHSPLVTSMLLFLFMLALHSTDVYAEEWRSSKKSIQNAAKKIKTIAAAFTQTKEMKILAKPLESKGRFLFKAPDNLRWEYQTPIKSLMLMTSGKTARFVSRDGKWVAERTGSLQAMQVVTKEIAHWLKGAFEASGAFSMTLERNEEDKATRVVLVPKEKALKAMIAKIILHLSKTPGLIEKVEIIEEEGVQTTLRFKQAVINEPLESHAFKAAK